LNLFKKNKWHKIQFHHRMQHSHGVIPRFTAAVEIPTKKQLIKMVQKLVIAKRSTITLKVGVAAVNPKDVYNKKIGRETSHSRLEKLQFEIKSALSVNNIDQFPPGLNPKNNEIFTSVELEAFADRKRISVWFKIDKRDKVVLANVQVHAWPNYTYNGYKKEKEESSNFDESQRVYQV